MKKILEQYKTQILVFMGILLVVGIVYMNAFIGADLKNDQVETSYPVADVAQVVKKPIKSVLKQAIVPEEKDITTVVPKAVEEVPSKPEEATYQKPMESLILVN